jgi:hypothetical protein
VTRSPRSTVSKESPPSRVTATPSRSSGRPEVARGCHAATHRGLRGFSGLPTGNVGSPRGCSASTTAALPVIPPSCPSNGNRCHARSSKISPVSVFWKR